MVNKLIKYFLGSVCIVLYLIWGFYSVKYPFWKDYTYIKCGVVTQTLNTIKPMKYTVSDEFYLGVKYDDGTFIGEKVDITTFMSMKINDRICVKKIDIVNKQKSSWSDMFTLINIIGILGFLCYYLVEVRKIFNSNE